MNKSWTKKLIIVFCIAFGAIARFVITLRGHNYDFDSYKIVVAANAEGLTPWQTNRYNYGPIWSYLLRFFDYSGNRVGFGFRYQIVGLLTTADLVITYFIYKTKSWVLALLFFVNPISIIISGFHNQFDNLAIAIVCLSVLIYKKIDMDNLGLNDVLVVVLLGLSLTTKHIFIFFIPWIAMRQHTNSKRLFYLSIPILIPLASMVPYLGSSWDSIKTNVLLYRSYNNAPFWNLLGIHYGRSNQLASILFISLMFVTGYFLRKSSIDQSFFYYCVFMVAFSSSIANQYLAISVVGAIGMMNYGYALYVLYGTFWLVTSADGLHLGRESSETGWLPYKEAWIQNLLYFGYQTFPVLLIFGLLTTFLTLNSASRSNLRTRNA